MKRKRSKQARKLYWYFGGHPVLFPRWNTPEWAVAFVGRWLPR